MKKTTFFLFFFLKCCLVQAQTKESENIVVFTKIWGFLKYHHPTVASGKLDWDKEYIVRLDDIRKISDNAKRNGYYSEWIDGLGVFKGEKVKIDKENTFVKNYDFDWINDKNLFNSKLIKKLNYIKNYRQHRENHYAEVAPNVGNIIFKNEKTYNDSVFPSIELRLLTLARYWNMINYFFPYKYQTDQNWNDVLTEMIPKFQNSKDTIAYHLTIAELIAKVNDSHANLSTPYTAKYFGLKTVPFYTKIIDNKAVVTHFYNDSLCKINDIRIGDVFYLINGDSIKTIIQKQKKYIGASNEPVVLRKLTKLLFNSNNDTILTFFERDGILKEKKISSHYFKDFKYKSEQQTEIIPWKMLNDSVAYVNMGLLMNGKTIEKKLKHCKAIVFDCRNYPNQTFCTIAQFLNPTMVSFTDNMAVDLLNPSLFYKGKPHFCSYDNPDYYKGLVVVLMDENTQSQAEYTIMSFQTAPKAVLIGSQTAGADGNVSTITFPGNYKCYMTGIGVFYPNGKETQRIGLVPDIEVKPTIQGIKDGRDEVLERAMQEIEMCMNKN